MNIRRMLNTGALSFLLFVALGVHAQSGGSLGQDISGLISFVNSYIVPLIFGIAFIVFLWGVFMYFIAGAGNDEKRKEGRSFILYAIIGFFLMLTIWGIVNLLRDSFCNNGGANCSSKPTLPTF